jgi:hypothetical protein
MTAKPYWIKERDNPQLRTYYVALGQLSAREAKSHEWSLYGCNTMHRYDTEAEYVAALAKLKAEGKRVQP